MLGETQVIAFDLAGISVSAGAACSSGKVTASHVLKAMGFGEDIASERIRVSMGWTTNAADVDTIHRRLDEHLRAVLGHAGRPAPVAVAAASLRRCSEW